ncbi:MAG: hypothetical protein ACHQYP_06370 [Nitrospiria bacterium]
MQAWFLLHTAAKMAANRLMTMTPGESVVNNGIWSGLNVPTNVLLPERPLL